MWLTATTGMLGDASYWYKVEGIPEGLTLSEAIKWIGDLDRDESGRIRVKEDGDGTYRGNEVARYGSFGVESSDNDRLASLSDREVEKIEANGGWGQLNFEIKLKKLTI
jgi:hypothetical protein